MTIKVFVLFFNRILMFVLTFLLPHPIIEQRSRKEQEYEKERKKKYIVISLTFHIIKSTIKWVYLHKPFTWNRHISNISSNSYMVWGKSC